MYEVYRPICATVASCSVVLCICTLAVFRPLHTIVQQFRIHPQLTHHDYIKETEKLLFITLILAFYPSFSPTS